MEDRSFYTNHGLDLSGTLRALIANIRGQEIVQGGSTITQQYVKNAYVGTERTLERKVKEAVLGASSLVWLTRTKSCSTTWTASIWGKAPSG